MSETLRGSLLSNRALARLAVADLNSAFGDYALFLALSVWIYNSTNSISLAASNYLFFLLGAATAPISGNIVDKISPKPALVGGNILNALVLLPLLAVNPRSQFIVVFIVTFAYGALGGLLSSSEAALLPRVVDDEGDLAKYNALRQLIRRGMRVLAPLSGVVLLSTLGATSVIVIDIASFVIAAVAVAGIRLTTTGLDGFSDFEETEGLRTAMGGFVWLRRDRSMLVTVMSTGLALGFLGWFEALNISIATRGFGLEASFVGVFISAQGVGTIVSSIFAGRAVNRWGTFRLSALSIALFAISALVQTVPSLPLVIAAMGLAGIALPVSIVALVTMVQLRTPLQLMGRVNGAIELVLSVPQLIGIASGALLVAYVDFRVMLFVLGIILAAISTYAWVSTSHADSSRKVAVTSIDAGSGDAQ